MLTNFDRHNLRNACTTAIYMAEGMSVSDEIREAWCQGELELMMELSEYAIMSEEILRDMNPEDYPGVYDYEVSTNFGDWFGKYIVEHKGAPTTLIAEEKLRNLIKGWFKCE